MEAEAEQKFLNSKQEALRLSIALERFFAPELSQEWRKRYGDYLNLRIRPAMARVIELDDTEKAKRLLELVSPESGMLDGFIKMAAEKKRLEILDFLLRRKWGFSGSLEKSITVVSRKPERAGRRSEARLWELGERVWILVRNGLSLKYPFLRAFWHRFTFQEWPRLNDADPDADKVFPAYKSGGTEAEDTETGKRRRVFCGTDGRRIFYDAKSLLWLFVLDPDSVQHLFLHMSMHVLLLHADAAPQEDMRLWNLACDMAAKRMAARLMEWKMLPDASENEIRPGKQKEEAGKEPAETLRGIQRETAASDGYMEREIRAKKLYEYLKTALFSEEQLQMLEKKYGLDSHRMWRMAKGLEEKELLREVRTAAESLRRHAGAGDGGLSDAKGSAKGSAAEKLSQLQKREISYRDFLERFTVSGEEIRLDEESFDYIPYLFGLSHYKNMPLIEHLEYREARKIAELVIVIDTSGSCKTETVRRFMEETYAILSDRKNFFKEMNVYILQCDFCVQDEAHITCERDWKQYLSRLTVQGRSGTDFRPAFARVETLRRERKLADLKGLLYFTDGDGIYPETPTDYDTAFLFYREKERHQKVPDWAWTIRLQDGKPADG